MNPRAMDAMTRHYLVTGLWSTLDYSTDSDCLDKRYDVDSLSDEFVEQAKKDCADLYTLIHPYLEEGEIDLEQLGHDFWLTRCGHGAGFWDGDYKNGEEISRICNRLFKDLSDDINDAINKEDKFYVND